MKTNDCTMSAGPVSSIDTSSTNTNQRNRRLFTRGIWHGGVVNSRSAI